MCIGGDFIANGIGVFFCREWYWWGFYREWYWWGIVENSIGGD